MSFCFAISAGGGGALPVPSVAPLGPPHAAAARREERMMMLRMVVLLSSPQSSFAGGSTAMTGAVRSESPRSSDAVGNSSGLICPSSRSHSFDHSENQPSSVDFDRHTPYAVSDFSASGSAAVVSASQ